MHRRRLEIVQPCTNDWTQMPGTSTVRHCSSCAKSVYNLSMLTRREAEAALAVRPESVCIRYHFDAEGQVVFFEDAQTVRRHAASRHAIAAAVAVSAISACTQPALPEKEAPKVAVARAAAKSPEPSRTPAAVPNVVQDDRARPAEVHVRPAEVHARPAECQAKPAEGPNHPRDWKQAFEQKGRDAKHLRFTEYVLGGMRPVPEPSPTASGPQTVPSRAQLLAVLHQAQSEITAAKCRGPGVAIASLQIAGSSGDATSVSVTGVDAAAASCVANVVRRTAFPKFLRQRFAVKFPFKLGG